MPSFANYLGVCIVVFFKSVQIFKAGFLFFLLINFIFTLRDSKSAGVIHGDFNLAILLGFTILSGEYSSKDLLIKVKKSLKALSGSEFLKVLAQSLFLIRSENFCFDSSSIFQILIRIAFTFLLFLYIKKLGNDR